MEELSEIRKNKILELVSNKEYKPMTESEMAFLMEVPLSDRDLFNSIIESLLKEGRILFTKKSKIMAVEGINIVYGTFYGNARGFGFVRGENSLDDIFVAAEYVNGAMHKDKVLCRVINSGHGLRRRREGEVIQVLERGLNHIVGVFQQAKRNQGFVIPDDTKISEDIFISREHTKGAVNGHKVVAKIIKPAAAGKSPEGVITEILGHKNDPGVEVLSVIASHGLSVEFSSKIYKEVEHIKDHVTEEDKTGRIDLRSVQMVTIDGEDSKDLDDAVSLVKLDNGHYQLGVHIADVSHYVTRQSELDKEALKRGTSVYLVDRVIPMLPHALSNGICSLNPNVERLALSCIMEIDPKGVVVSHDIFTSVIQTDQRMTYTIVNEILTDQTSPYRKEYNELVPMFELMCELSGILREKRLKRGAIEFGFAECKIIVDKYGKPIEIKPYVRNIATSLIEEFMLVCNETIAEEYYWLELPFVYRTHEEPDSEKMDALSEFIQKIGYRLKGNSSHPKSIQKLLASVENKPEEMVISKVVLRSLKQARYTIKNDGHFGLAAKYYCHFTSPIRRYPDLQIHRIIKQHISGEMSDSDIQHLSKVLPDVCKSNSKSERTAEEAEREVENIKKAQFMKDKVGWVFNGIISGVTNWGIYVELPNTIEGMVSVNDLDDDYYIYDANNLCYVGEHTKQTYSLGDKVSVELTRVNTDQGKLDFVFQEQENK